MSISASFIGSVVMGTLVILYFLAWRDWMGKEPTNANVAGFGFAGLCALIISFEWFVSMATL